MHVIMYNLEVQTTCFVIEGGVHDIWVLLVDGGESGEALQSLRRGGVKLSEVEACCQVSTFLPAKL
jgi:hypothetical protein